MQTILTYLIVAAAVAFIIYRLVQKNRACGPCDGCTLKDACNRKPTTTSKT